jgi:hypothetical protein
VCVPPDDVAAFVSLELPWRNDYDVAFPYPDASFHFASNSAQTFSAILAFYHDSVETQQLGNYA